FSRCIAQGVRFCGNDARRAPPAPRAGGEGGSGAGHRGGGNCGRGGVSASLSLWTSPLTRLASLRLRSARKSTSPRTRGEVGASRASEPINRRPSLDLGFAELDVLLGDRIVFLLAELVGHGARVLLGHVVEAGVGARHEL